MRHTMWALAVAEVAAAASAPLLLRVDGRAAAALHSNGSAAAPFSTVQQCVDAAPGDAETICAVAEGTYREAVRVGAGRTAPLHITGAGQRTEMTGALPVADEWEPHSGLVWKTQLAPALRSDVQQLFLSGEMLFEARWPNAELQTIASPVSWAVTNDSQPPNDTAPVGYVTDDAMAGTGVDWTGALATLQVGSRVWTYTRRVSNHSAGSGTFTYEGPLYPMSHYGRTLQCLYFLSGKLEALDSPGEWFLDQSTWTLYVWSPDGASPGDRVEVKMHDLCVDVEGPKSAPVHVSNMTMRGCTFVLGVDSSSASDMSLRYPSYAREITFRNPLPSPPPNVTALFCNDCSVQRLHMQYSNIAGIFSVGSGNVLQELLMEDIDWFGSLDFPPIQIGFSKMQCNYHNSSTFDPFECGHMLRTSARPRLGHPFGERNVVTRATLRRYGANGIVTSQFSNEVSYVWMTNGTTIGLDSAGLHADNLGAQTTSQCQQNNCTKRWHHNWIHRQRDKCVRGDDGTMNLTADHNVIWNCGTATDPRVSGCGLMLKGDGHYVYANTIFDGHGGQGDLVIDTRNGSPCGPGPDSCVPGNRHTEVFNSAFKRLGTKGHDPPPVPTTVAFYSGIVRGNESDLMLRDVAGYDFRPAPGSPLIGAGVVHPPYAPGGGGGGGVDAGAYQHDDAAPWRPGCTFSPLCP